MRSKRRRDLVRILREGSARSQHDIVEVLTSAGHHVTQATVSRDLRELGAVKVRRDGGFVYRLPDDAPRPAAGDSAVRNLMRTLSELALDVRQAASLVVVVTPPGMAAPVARAIDLAGLQEVVGTVAGDDTVFVAAPSAAVAGALAQRWRSGEVQSANGGAR